MGLLENVREQYLKAKDEEMSLMDYLELCRNDPLAYATPAERMLAAIGEPELIDTRTDPRLSRIFSNRLIPRYPAFAEFYGMEDVISQIVAFFKHAAQGLEEKKQVLYLLGPVGGGKSSIAERLKKLMEEYPIYALKDSPINESPLGLFDPERDGRQLRPRSRSNSSRRAARCSSTSPSRQAGAPLTQVASTRERRVRPSKGLQPQRDRTRSAAGSVTSSSDTSTRSA